MIFGSVCSGIEAASVAWHPLGWKAAWLAEIEAFPSAVLAHHYPNTPNLGDMTTLWDRVLQRDIPAPDVMVGGTPCQAFSVAGLRGGLSDKRGQLTLSYVELANAIDDVRAADGLAPGIFVWENVPGVLSSKDNAFGCFLAGLAGEDRALVAPGGGKPKRGKPKPGKWSNAGCVFGPERTVAWRVLDAQYFGVAQRRRRVFVVASARKGFDPATVLFESEGVRRDSAPSRKSRENVAGTLAARTDGGGFPGSDEVCSGYVQPVVSSLDASYGRLQGCSGQDLNHGHSHLVTAFGGNNTAGPIDVATARNACASASASGRMDFESETFLVHPVIGFSSKDYGADASVEIAPTMRAMGHAESHANAGGQIAVAFAENSRAELRLEGGDGSRTGALSAGGGKPGQGMPVIAFQSSQSGVRTGGTHATLDANNGPRRHNGVIEGMGVRRLSPRECERLQGFPGDYTLIPFGKPSKAKLDADFLKYQLRGNPRHLTRDDITRLAADGPRYKAIGNSMAVPCMRWIGERIAAQVGTP